jgi:hypothetical protein
MKNAKRMAPGFEDITTVEYNVVLLTDVSEQHACSFLFLA